MLTHNFTIILFFLLLFASGRNYSQTSIIRSVRDRQIFFELSVVRIFEIGTFRKCSVVFVLCISIKNGEQGIISYLKKIKQNKAI